MIPMTPAEMLDDSAKLDLAWIDMQAKLDKFVQDWLDGKTIMGTEEVEKLVDTATQQIEQMKVESDRIYKEYLRIKQEEAYRDNAVRSVKNNLNSSPNEVIITGGTLSSNANESHLEGRTKTPEELEQERLNLLTQVKNKVMSKEITLAQASKLSQDINVAYGNVNFNNETEMTAKSR